MSSDSLAILDDDFTISQLSEMGVDLSLGLILAPILTESGEMIYPATTPTVRKLMKSNNIPLIFPHEGQSDIKYLEKRSFDWYAPIIVVTSLFATNNPNAINVALGIITTYLADGLKGFSFSGKANLSIIVQKKDEMDKRIEYSGPVSGIDKIGSVVEKLLLDDEQKKS